MFYNHEVVAVTSERLTVGLLFVVIITLGCLAPAQNDTWWHLRAGLDIWRSHTVSLQDTYSYTAAGRFWPNHEWLTEVVFYGLYRAGGMPLLAALCGTLIAGAWALSWRLAKGPIEIRFLLFAAGVVTSTGSWAIRPQVFSLALFTLTCTLLVAGRLRWLPIIFVVWANLHGAVAIGVLAVVAATIGVAVNRRTVPWAMLFTSFACALATCVSPLGPRLWPEILASIERSRINQIWEWLGPGLDATMWPFWMLAAALPVLVVLRRRQFTESTAMLAAVALAMLPLAVRSVRNIPVFLLVAVPAVSTLAVRSRSSSRAGRAPGEHERVNAAILFGAAAVAAALVAAAWSTSAPRLRWRPMSVDAAAAVSACPDPLYNTYEEGGALIWFVPGKRVFLDSRQDPYPLGLALASRQLEADGEFDALFAEYGVRCAVLPPASPIAERLRRDPAWNLHYADDRWTVFSKRQRPSRRP